MRRPQIGCTGRGRNVAISNVSVGATATLVAAGNPYRDTLTIQHVDTTHSAVAVWIGTDPAIEASEGLYLSGLGAAVAISRAAGAGCAWYGVVAADTAIVAVGTGER